MENSIEEIVSSIDNLTSLEKDEDLSRLDELVDLYFKHPQAGEYLKVWFLLYERCEDNSNDIFWSILHGIETYHPSADSLVVESVIRQPSEFPLMMINRLLNAGIERVGETNLLELLKEVATNVRYSSIIQENARNYLVDRGTQNTAEGA
jgi:hypothetical protein